MDGGCSVPAGPSCISELIPAALYRDRVYDYRYAVRVLRVAPGTRGLRPWHAARTIPAACLPVPVVLAPQVRSNEKTAQAAGASLHGWLPLASLASFRENSFDEARMEPKVMMLNQFLDQRLDGGDVSGRFSAE
jgi:hypothetical protein